MNEILSRTTYLNNLLCFGNPSFCSRWGPLSPYPSMRSELSHKTQLSEGFLWDPLLFSWLNQQLLFPLCILPLSQPLSPRVEFMWTHCLTPLPVNSLSAETFFLLCVYVCPTWRQAVVGTQWMFTESDWIKMELNWELIPLFSGFCKQNATVICRWWSCLPELGRGVRCHLAIP